MSLRDSITEMGAQFSGRRGAIAILDTNVLLHHQPLKHVKWPDIVASEHILLAVPRRVVQELDGRKYAGTKLGDRARKRIQLLSNDVAMRTIRDGVDVEIVGSIDLDPDAARRPAIPVDEEVIEIAEGWSPMPALTRYAW
jgi:PIN domain